MAWNTSIFAVPEDAVSRADKKKVTDRINQMKVTGETDYVRFDPNDNSWVKNPELAYAYNQGWIAQGIQNGTFVVTAKGRQAAE